MEDSYTVHRRRKAAARRREKTPDPPRREEESGEDDTVARAKMERMVEDTENMALQVDEERPTGDVRVEKVRQQGGSGIGIGDQPERATLESGIETEVKPSNNADNALEAAMKMIKKSVTESDGSSEQPAKFSHVSESTVRPRDETDVPTSQNDTENIENVAVDTAPKRHPDEKMAAKSEDAEFHPKKRPRDRSAQSKQFSLTDSSEDQDEGMRSLRRKKSPEGFRTKTRPRHAAPSVDTDEDRSTSNAESKVKLGRDKRRTSRHRYSTGTEDESGPRKSDSGVFTKSFQQVPLATDNEPRAKVREKRSLSRHRYPSGSDDEVRMRKSETFPQRSEDKQIIRRSASEMKKQIIPLKDDSLIEDFAKAQEDYLKRERGILEHDDMDDWKYKDHKIDATTLRKRKLGVPHSDPEETLRMKDKEDGIKGEVKKSWFSWLPFFRQKQKQKIDDLPLDDSILQKPSVQKVSFLEVLKAIWDIVTEFRAYVDQNPREVEALKKLRNSCIGEFIVIVIYCGLGAFAFRFTEGAFETFYKCGVKRVKRDFLDNLWNYSHNMREDDWKSMARRKLMEFEEQLHSAHEAGVHSYSGQKNWTFLNALAYCISVITTVGYGDISPKTQAGKAITIVYAIFGIPMFLIILADFGKLFTRGMKFLWAFVRRVYYTGSCRKVRRTGPVQEVMKGVQLVYDFATFRRPSQMNPEEVEEIQRQQTQTILNLDGNLPQPETPGTPAMSNFVIDDEFNLPISVAISLLLGYIFVGATVYQISEGWGFFESFYFVFISMSTIGFGDYVPQNSLVKMLSLVYLFFGLALTSMCINVVQVMLSDSFKKASQKIGASIGFEVAATDGAEGAVVEVLGEDDPVGEEQVTVKKSQEEISAPKAKPEDVEL